MTHLARPELDHSLIWRPIFDRPIALEPVSPHARRIDERLLYYQRCALAMRAEVHEQHDIVEVLQLIECTDGALEVLPHLPLLTITLAAAVASLGRSISELGTQREYPTAGIFVGALLESALGERLQRRRVPVRAFQPRFGSPHLEFEDFTTGAQLFNAVSAWDNTQLARNESAIRAFGALAWVARQRFGRAAATRLQSLADTKSATADLRSFVHAVDGFSRANDMALPASWRSFRHHVSAGAAHVQYEEALT